MDEARLAELKRRIREHPAFHGGPADEAYWLDYTEAMLALFPEGHDTMAEIMAGVALKRPEIWPAYVEASNSDLLFWKIVRVMVRLSRPGASESYNVPEDAFQCLNEWALDAATEVRREPKERRDERKMMMRNLTIVIAVHGIREVSGIPYEFDEPKAGDPRSACHVVADRLGWTYGKVRSIWRKGRPLLERAQKQELVPPSRKKTRRTRRIR